MLLIGSFGLFFTMFCLFVSMVLLFVRFMPMIAIAEVKGVMPQADPHGHGHGSDLGQPEGGHV